MPRAQGDIPLSDLIGPNGIVSVTDPEIAHGREPRMVLNETIVNGDTRQSFLYAVDIDENTGLIVGPGGGAPTPVQEVDSSGTMVEVGVTATFPAFPNGAEWTNDSARRKSVFYSAKTGDLTPVTVVVDGTAGGWNQVRIQRTRFNRNRSAWEAPRGVQFAEVRDRYLFAANYSDPNHPDEALDDKVIFFASAEPGALWNDERAPADVRWARVSDDPGFVHQDIPLDTGSLLDNPLASPVRPIPGTYSAFVARSIPDGQGNIDLQLTWVDLYPLHIGSRDSEKSIQLYFNMNRGKKLLGLGARRCPMQDDLGPGGLGHSFLLYAYFSSTDPDQPLAWCDVFWVYFNQGGTLGRSMLRPDRAFAWDPNDPVHVSDAWRILPMAPADLGFPFIIDDENFEGNDGYPRAVFTFGSIGAAANPFDVTDPFFAQDTEIYVYSLWRPGGNRNGVHDDLRTPLVAAPSEELLVSEPVVGAGGSVWRKDAEPLTLHPNDGGPRETFIYYLAPPSVLDVHNKLRRTDAAR